MSAKIYRKNCDPSIIKQDQLERDIKTDNVLRTTLETLVSSGFDVDKGVYIFRGTYEKVTYDLTSLSHSKNLFVLAQKQDV